MKIVLYTHTDTTDVWDIFFGQTKKYLNEFEKIIIVDKDHEKIPSDYSKIYYNDNHPYRLRLLETLSQIDDEYFIFHHEDMFLYDTPDITRIYQYLDHLKNTPNMSFIKLIRGGSQVGISDENFKELKRIDKNFEYIFAIQPCIWKKSKFIELLTYSEGHNIWDFEVKVQATCRNRNIYGWYVDDGGIQRGKFHWDSKVYPYIATAVVKGKWNKREYPFELGMLFNEYNVDYKLRGTND